MESKTKDNLQIWNEVTEGSSSVTKGSELLPVTGYGKDTSLKHHGHEQRGASQTDLSRLPLPDNHSVKINTDRIRVVKDEDSKRTNTTIAAITKPCTSNLNPYIWYADMFRKQRDRRTRKQVTKGLLVVVVAGFLTLAIIMGIAVFLWNRDKILT